MSVRDFVTRKDVVYSILAIAALMMLLRNGLRIGSMDDFAALVDARSHTYSFVDELKWGRWLTVIELKVLQALGVPPMTANRYSYVFYELSLAAMNVALTSRLLGRLNVTSVVCALFLSLTGSWLILSNFDKVTISLTTVFLAVTWLCLAYDNSRRALVVIALVTIVVFTSYQGSLYVLIVCVTALVLSDYVGDPDRTAGGALWRLLQSAAVMAVCLIIGHLLSGVAVASLNLKDDALIKVAVGSSEQLQKHVTAAHFFLWSRDWLLLPRPNQMHWRHATYAFAAVTALYTVAKSVERPKVAYVFAVLVALAGVLAAQPLQLVAGHPDLPNRAFGFMSYLVVAVVLITASAARAKDVLFADGISRAAAGYFGVLCAVLCVQTATIVGTVEQTRTRDIDLVRQVADFYRERGLPVTMPLAFVLSDPADEPRVASVAEAVGALRSPLLADWSNRSFVTFYTTLRPLEPNAAQAGEAVAKCRTMGKDGYNPKIELLSGVVGVCL